MSEHHLETAAVHAGRLVPPENTPSSPALYQASSYEFESLDEVEAIYSGAETGRIYGRYGGPNAAQFEAAIAQLEGAEAAAGAAAGMSAIHAAFAVLAPRDRPIVVSREVYGGTATLLENDYRNAGYSVVYVDQHDPIALAERVAALQPSVVYVEALTNPLVRVTDLRGIAHIAHDAGARLVVDATFATPILCRPLEHGADLVLHSVGKYIAGHGDVGAGVVCGSGALIEPIRAKLVRTGATIPHFEAWLALRGLRTLALRMERHSSNATEVAAYLARSPHVAAVHHPSLVPRSGRAAIDALYPRGTGGIVAFDLNGGADAVRRFLPGLRTIAIVHSLGEVATTISYPAVSSHRPLDAQARAAAGAGPGTLRLSTGIEHPGDIVADLALGFAGLA